MKSRAQSYVRVRPLLEAEKGSVLPGKDSAQEVLTWDGHDCVTLLDPQDDYLPRRNGTFKGMNVLWSFQGGVNSANNGHSVITQKEVYDKVVAPAIPKIVEGYNTAFLIAGGAGSGRVHTLYGPDMEGAERGILPRFADDIFDAFDKLNHDNSTLTSLLEVVEISGEQYVDVLAVKRTANNRRGVDDGVEMKIVGGSDGPRLSGATEMELRGAADLKAALKQIMRTVRKRNTTHTVTIRFTETFEFEDPEHYSQSISQSRHMQVVFVLMRNLPPTFQRCFDIAVEHDSGENPLARVPVRETSFTKLFPGIFQQEFSLYFISCLSPYYEHMREDLNTLQFAVKTKKLIGFPQLNQDEELVDMRRLADEVKNLKVQVRKQSQAMEVVQKELNAREVELMKQEVKYNQVNTNIKEGQEQLKLATIGRNLEADRTRVVRKDLDAKLKQKKKDIASTKSEQSDKSKAFEQAMRDADDAKVRTEAINDRVKRQQQNAVTYAERKQKNEAEVAAVQEVEDFNIASPDEQERLIIAKSTKHLQAEKDLEKLKEEEQAVKEAEKKDEEAKAVQMEYNRVLSDEKAAAEKDKLLKEIEDLEKEIAKAQAETLRLQAEMDKKKKAGCSCATM